jgi:hypothetical protein
MKSKLSFRGKNSDPLVQSNRGDGDIISLVVTLENR